MWSNYLLDLGMNFLVGKNEKVLSICYKLQHWKILCSSACHGHCDTSPTTVEHFVQDCHNDQNPRADTWLADTTVRETFYSSKETLYSVLVRHTVDRPRSGELQTQKLKSNLVRTQSLNVLLLKPGVGQFIAMHGTLTARDFFLAYLYPSGPFICICFQNISRVFPVLAVANTGPV